MVIYFNMLIFVHFYVKCVKYFESLHVLVNIGAKVFYIESILAEPGTQCSM